MSEYRLAEKPTLDALAAMGWQVLSPAQALAMREEENRVILKPVLIDALRTLNGIGADDAEAIYNDLATLSDNEEWQRKLRGGYRNGFIVDLPHWAGKDADHLVASELKLWLKQRARRDVQEIAADYGQRFGLVPRTIRTTDLAHGWGSCGPEGNVLIHWHLIFAPRKVLEYVVVHELAHLKHRSHGAEFWACLAVLMPGCESSRSWLDRHQSALSASFLA